MRIAFVGKGGSGKSTLCSIFSTYFGLATAPQSTNERELWLFDADLNMHQPALCGFEEYPPSMTLSEAGNVLKLKESLIGSSTHVSSSSHFVKTTPPCVGSGMLRVDSIDSSPLSKLRRRDQRLSLFVVGTYDARQSGTQCFHNNLAILENILSHTIDDELIVVADMVAGSDAFASSLHLLFDVFALVVEPTPESVDVAIQFIALAKEVGIEERILLVGNKIETLEDERYIAESLSLELAVSVAESPAIKSHRRARQPLRTLAVSAELRFALSQILSIADSRVVGFSERLKKLQALHRRYVAQGYIRDRLGDLSNQADPSFSDAIGEREGLNE